METDRRVAKFRFIKWQDGPETIRQKSYPIKFFQSGRSMTSVLSRHTLLKEAFDSLYGKQYAKVRDWYAAHGSGLKIFDAAPWLSELAEILIEEAIAAEDV